MRQGFAATWIAATIVATPQAMAQPRTLDAMDDPSTWTLVTSDQVLGRIERVAAPGGHALCLAYDFNGVSGYAGLRRELPIDYPANYAFAYRLRGEGPANDLQFKLADDSGDNVWWVNRPKLQLPADWAPVRHRARHITRAWGPAPDPTLRRSRSIEFTVYSSVGGTGRACFDALGFEPLPPQDDAPLTATARATRGDAGRAVDGDAASAWTANAGDALTLDLGKAREFGGLRVTWLPGRHARDYRIALSSDGTRWSDARAVRGGDGGEDAIALPESEARYVRIAVSAADGQGAALAEATVQPLAFAATPNDFVKSIAARAPRGRFPRGFHGEQPYWTVVGIDGGREQGLIGEDGAIEVAKGGYTIEPVVLVDGRALTWADVDVTQSLQDGSLPIPSVHWTGDGVRLDVTAFADGVPERSRLFGRYRLTNMGASPREFVLALAVRPFQVNPPSQFLNTIGGVSRIERLVLRGDRLDVAGRAPLRFHAVPDAALGGAFDGGEIVARLARGDAASARTAQAAVEDPDVGLASAAALYRVRLGPGESRAFAWHTMLAGTDEAALPDAAAAQDAVAAAWRRTLDAVRIRVPPEAQRLVDTIRTSLAHMLVSRIGPRLQPGTRSYSRAWIRDGAMIAEGLLRLGREDVAEEFLRWYAPYQFDTGKVPCCVDDRGSDPVPENDSHGQLIYTAAEIWRYTGDRALLESMWPHVRKAVAYMDTLRASERTEANRARNPAFYGLMPASISHEGYSAKPMHSYWDDFWALRGYKDAVVIAEVLGHREDARRFAASRDEFAADLYASIDIATKQHAIDFIPGAAELGDFDATSTTIALAPGGEQARLPQRLLRNTFERYWREFEARRDGTRPWKDYTPYELRTIGTFARLGWRDRAHEALDFFFRDQRPQAWKQWAEVVSRTPRTPFFLGDIPHAWVGSDYVRSALDLFAYAREDDAALVIAAGVPPAWLAGEGVAVEGLRTPHGPLTYALRRDGRRVVLELGAGLRVPPGGIVLPWPDATPRGIDGPATWREGALRIDRVPATVSFEAP